MSAADARERAQALIDEAEQMAKAHMQRLSGSEGEHYAFESGWLRGTVRDLCHEVEDARSVEGIVRAIATLPSRHADLLAVLTALHERIDHEYARIQSFGYAHVADHLEAAIADMADCGELDADALAHKQRDWALDARADEAIDERRSA